MQQIFEKNSPKYLSILSVMYSSVLNRRRVQNKQSMEFIQFFISLVSLMTKVANGKKYKNNELK